MVNKGEQPFAPTGYLQHSFFKLVLDLLEKVKTGDW
ncbi:hypothetical protein Cal7507_5941 [Calothrix sp. PCC 7507]|nr:hypothetical protein Cal7507_5941 [Calothrix sp. PCC 7507]